MARLGPSGSFQITWHPIRAEYRPFGPVNGGGWPWRHLPAPQSNPTAMITAAILQCFIEFSFLNWISRAMVEGGGRSQAQPRKSKKMIIISKRNWLFFFFFRVAFVVVCRFFNKRGYPLSVVQADHHRAQQIDRQSSLQPAEKENTDRIPFALTFHPHNHAVKSIIL